MNGNFEVDKSAYPYAVGHRGNKVLVRNVQTLEEVSQVNVGPKVGEAVALRLNALYWSRKVDKLQESLDGIEALIKATAKDLYDIRSITATLYQSVVQQLAPVVEPQG